jgi:hypothetical protein
MLGLLHDLAAAPPVALTHAFRLPRSSNQAGFFRLTAPTRSVWRAAFAPP